MVQEVMEIVWSVERYWSEVLSSSYYNISVNKCGVKLEHRKDFAKIEVRLMI